MALSDENMHARSHRKDSTVGYQVGADECRLSPQDVGSQMRVKVKDEAAAQPPLHGLLT